MVGQTWNVRRSVLLFLPSLALLTVCYYYYGTPSLVNHKSHNRFLQVKTQTQTYKEKPKSGKIILFWTTFFESQDFYVGFGNKPFQNCQTSSCFTTNDRSLLNQSDAVIFHIRNTNLEDLPSTRLPHQRWIFFLQESPSHTPNILSSLPNFFNWTMTYRLDSDIYAPYTISENALKQQKIRMEENSPNTSINEYWKKLVKKKKKIAAWFVSNCFTSSERERYVAELKKYIEIDVYGTCGTLECVNRLECYDMLERDYKFYLSFENSLCRDYVTEKFYNALQFTTVPIVYGSANYSTVAPRKSYIDVRDFSSAHELAKYLKFLIRDDSAYLRYFDWRDEPSSLIPLPRRFHTWCKLCEMLNNLSLPNHSYANIHHWWFELGHCGRDHNLFQQIV